MGHLQNFITLIIISHEKQTNPVQHSSVLLGCLFCCVCVSTGHCELRDGLGWWQTQRTSLVHPELLPYVPYAVVL